LKYQPCTRSKIQEKKNSTLVVVVVVGVTKQAQTLDLVAAIIDLDLNFILITMLQLPKLVHVDEILLVCE